MGKANPTQPASPIVVDSAPESNDGGYQHDEPGIVNQLMPIAISDTIMPLVGPFFGYGTRRKRNE